MSVFSKIPKGLTVLATAAALVAGVAYAQTNTDPAQPKPNATGEPGSAIGNNNGGSTMNSGGAMGTMGNKGNMGTMGSSTDNSMSNAQTDIVSPKPRSDRN